MKILIILKNFNQRRGLPGGVGNANEEIAKEMEKLGHKVDFLSREDDMKIYSLWKSIFPIRKKVKELMNKNHYEVIFSQDWSFAFPLLFPKRIFKKNHICCFCGHQENWLIFLQNIVGKMMGEKLIVIGDDLKKRFPKATLIYRGVNFSKFKPLKRKRDCLCWTDKGDEYKMISEDELEKIAIENNLKLSIAKGIPSNKMNEFYNKCKVFISVPPQAGYNNSWNESMAAGVPIVIGNNKGGGTMLPLNRISKNEDNVKRINEIIKNPKKINYRKWLRDIGFAWENVAKKMINFFEKEVITN